MYKQTNWTAEEDKYLIENYKTKDLDKMAEELRRSKCAIRFRANKLGQRRKGNQTWTAEEVKRLKEVHKTMPIKEMEKEFGRSANSIYSKILRLGLAEEYSEWTKQDDDIIYKYYSTKTNYEIGRMIKKTGSQVASRAYALGIRRNHTDHSQSIKHEWTLAEREEVLKRYYEGIPIARMAKDYKTTKGDIRTVISELQESYDAVNKYSKNAIIDRYNLSKHKTYEVRKLLVDKNTIMRRKKVQIIEFYDNHFLIQTEKGIKESIKYTDLIDKDYVFEEVA